VGAFAAGFGAAAGLAGAAGLLGAAGVEVFFCPAAPLIDTAIKTAQTRKPRTILLLPSLQFISTLLAISPIILKSGTRLAIHDVSYGP
jgi:hypothetical protein